jgi:hypothetical protein
MSAIGSARRAPAGPAASRAAGETLELELDSLELEGLEPQQPERVRAALEAELARLIAERGLPARLSSRAEAAFDAGALTAGDLGSPERLGQAIARHIYAELAR